MGRSAPSRVGRDRAMASRRQRSRCAGAGWIGRSPGVPPGRLGRYASYFLEMSHCTVGLSAPGGDVHQVQPSDNVRWRQPENRLQSLLASRERRTVLLLRIELGERVESVKTVRITPVNGLEECAGVVAAT